MSTFPDESTSIRLQTPADRRDRGRTARSSAPRSSHSAWAPSAGRPDPVATIAAENERRLPWLVPLRHGRMRASPFTFFRGAADVMAADLAGTPTSGLTVQLGGDAHLSNFGAYASPERQLVFDANDFDETLPGPWEWDLKRLAASFTIAGQHRGFEPSAVRSTTARAVEAYRLAMAQYAEMGNLELWYQHLTAEDIRSLQATRASKMEKRLERFATKARSKDRLDAISKLAEVVDGRYRIRSQPPVLVPLRDLPAEFDPEALMAASFEAFDGYKESLAGDRRALLDRYTPIDVALKVVGVGSVGTRCLIMLLQGRDADDGLFLQVKEAGPSALEPQLGPSRYPNSGQRVVEGQRLVQAESDIFLGWAEGREGRQFFFRQLRDWKRSADIEGASPSMMEFYAQLCGMTLARGHARSGDAIAIAAYAGSGRSLDRALVEFGEAYARQNEQDFAAFTEALDSGRLERLGDDIDPWTGLPRV